MNTGSAARARPSGSSNRSRRVAFLTVPIARIRLHGWPGERCPGRVEELAGDIGYRGLRVPVSLVLAEGVFLVENGRHRIAAFTALGREAIPAFVLHTAEEAPLLARMLGETRQLPRWWRPYGACFGM